MRRFEKEKPDNDPCIQVPVEQKEVYSKRIITETFFITVLDLFNEHGSQFKLDDLASRLRISKKTIYRDFAGKEAVIEATVQEVFAAMHRQQQAIVENTELDIVEKMKQVICVYPPMKIDFERLTELGENYPRILRLIHGEFEANWDTTFDIIGQTIRSGRMKPVNLDRLRVVLLGIFSEILEKDAVEQPRITRECLDIVFNGYISEYVPNQS